MSNGLALCAYIITSKVEKILINAKVVTNSKKEETKKTGSYHIF